DGACSVLSRPSVGDSAARSSGRGPGAPTTVQVGQDGQVRRGQWTRTRAHGRRARRGTPSYGSGPPAWARPGPDAMARPAPGADRSVAVLELLANHPEERFTLSEGARRCDLNKATAHALLSALADHGVLLRHPAAQRYP